VKCRYRPACGRFRRDVPDHQAAGRTAEAAVGDQRDLAAQPLTDDRGRHPEHLAHARTTARALIADHDHIALVNLSPRHRRHCLFFAIKNSCRSAVHAALMTDNFGNRALRRQVAAQDA